MEEALASVIASDFGDIEILVVDDASTDDGPDRVIALQDARIRLIRHHENTGRGGGQPGLRCGAGRVHRHTRCR
ncbi:MAG: glycosyltransferase [Flavobacteriales bacterium]|nr:glycosyltransferase [Flavobacteriales bacterium]